MKYLILTMSLLAGMQLQAAQQATTVLFDTYVAEAGLLAVDATSGNTHQVIAGLGDQLIVAASSGAVTQPVAAANTVIRNTLTGELGILTGRVQIVANNAALVQTLSERFALQPLKSLRGGKVQLLEAAAGTDLVQLLQQLRQQPGVQAARLDVLENINTPQ